MDDVRTKENQVRLDARSVSLLRETGCQRAYAMASAATDITALSKAIEDDTMGRDEHVSKPGPAAMEFGKTFESHLTGKDGKNLKPSLLQLFKNDAIYGTLIDENAFREKVQAFSRINETGWGTGHNSIWRDTVKLIRERWTSHQRGAIIFQGILKIPHMQETRYVVPDALVSPPGIPYFIPFEIKSYQRMGHLTEERHIARASVQSSLYLYALMNGYDENGNPLPEVYDKRKDERAGLVFRSNGTLFADCMLVSAERDIIAIKTIFERIANNDKNFEEIFGQKYENIKNGSLDNLERIEERYSDACMGACRLVSRCKEHLRRAGSLSSYGNDLVKSYPNYENISEITRALQKNNAQTNNDPDLMVIRAVEREIDTLLERMVTTYE